MQILKSEVDQFHAMAQAVQSRSKQAQQHAFNVGANTRYFGNESMAPLHGFQVQGFLGQGSEGDVQEVREISTGDIYACKSVSISCYIPGAYRTKEQIKNEVAIMKKLVHDHITRVSLARMISGVY